MEELEKAGVTGYVGKVNMDRNGSPELQETTEQSKRETLRWLDACGRFQTVKPILTPRFTPSCTDELMSWLGKLAAERGLYVQSHLSENKGEIAWVKELCPDCAQYWESYDRAGLWKDHTVMAHCVHSDARERSAIRQAGVVVAHCPDSNINLCSGIAPVRQMLNEGLWVTLGSDIAAGSSLSGSLSSFVLGAIGYNVTAGAVQTAGVVNAIWKSYTGVYFLGYGIAVAILFFVYPLTKQKTAEMLTELKARRAAKESK